jgi:hypothetical protein
VRRKYGWLREDDTGIRDGDTHAGKQHHPSNRVMLFDFHLST